MALDSSPHPRKFDASASVGFPDARAPTRVAPTWLRFLRRGEPRIEWTQGIASPSAVLGNSSPHHRKFDASDSVGFSDASAITRVAPTWLRFPGIGEASRKWTQCGRYRGAKRRLESLLPPPPGMPTLCLLAGIWGESHWLCALTPVWMTRGRSLSGSAHACAHNHPRVG
jgi:hypothetical protein